MYKIYFDKEIIKDLRKIDKKNQVKIIEVIETKIAQNPYEGKKLLGDLSNFYRE